MSIETMKLALEFIDANADGADERDIALALRQAIEQAQKQEPDYYGLTSDHLWMSITKDHYNRLKPEFRMACYTSSPQRQWVGLTDEDDLDWEEGGNLKDLVKAIEAKLKEKNT